MPHGNNFVSDRPLLKSSFSKIRKSNVSNIFSLIFSFLKSLLIYIICLIEVNTTNPTPKVTVQMLDEFCVNIKKI